MMELHTFSIDRDYFSPSQTGLDPLKTYYYTVVAYAYNEYLEYAPDQLPDPNDIYAPSFNGQKNPFWQDDIT